MVKKKNLPALSEPAKRIIALRNALNLTKVGFADMFNVSRGSESHWETGRFEPSAEKYFQMGAYALRLGNPAVDYRWFWQRAGLDVGDLYRLTSSFAEDVKRNEASVPKADFFHAKLLRDLRYVSEPEIAPSGAVEMIVHLPSFFAANGPDSIVCLRIPNELSSLARAPHFDVAVKKVQAEGFLTSPEREHFSAPLFRKGDIAVIDLSARNLSELEGQLVALSFSYQVKFASSSNRSEAWSAPVLHVGWLRRGEIPLPPPDSSFGRERAAQLKSENKLLKKTGLPSRAPDVASPYYYLFPSPDAAGRPLASAITNFGGEPQLSNGYRLLGRVIGWIANVSPSISEKVKP